MFGYFVQLIFAYESAEQKPKHCPDPDWPARPSSWCAASAAAPDCWTGSRCCRPPRPVPPPASTNASPFLTVLWIEARHLDRGSSEFYPQRQLSTVKRSDIVTHLLCHTLSIPQQCQNIRFLLNSYNNLMSSKLPATGFFEAAGFLGDFFSSDFASSWSCSCSPSSPTSIGSWWEIASFEVIKNPGY